MGRTNPGFDNDKLHDALRALERIDGMRHLNRGVAIGCFAIAAGCGAYAFLLLIHLVTWEGMNEHGAVAVMSVSWVLLFPVWIFAFLGLMVLFDALGVRDLRGLAIIELSRLQLEPGTLDQLSAAVDERVWMHRGVLKAALVDLERASRTPAAQHGHAT